MPNGTVNGDKVIGIANRLRAAPKSERAKVLAELIAAIDEEGAEAPRIGPKDGELTPSNDFAQAFKDAGIKPDELRAMLYLPEVKDNPLLLACVANMLISQRD